MPFDPNFPVANTTATSAQMRAQFGALKALIDAAPGITGVAVDGVATVNPGDHAAVTLSLVGTVLHFGFSLPRGLDGAAGADGATGAQGPPFAGVVLDGVTTLNPGDPASADVFFDGTNVHFTFHIPRGNDGNQGPPGGTGGDGPQGIQGPPGQPFATAVVDGVTTLNPGEAATVQTVFDGTNVRFTFGLPRGSDGAPGEVTQAQLDTAIAGTSANTNAISTLGITVSDPPTQSEMQAIANKLDELILNGRR